MSNLVDVDMSPLFLRVDHVAADMPPSHAVKHMCRLADRMGLMVCCEVNGVDVSVHPETNENVMMDRYDRALEKNAKWVTSNMSPITLNQAGGK